MNQCRFLLVLAVSVGWGYGADEPVTVTNSPSTLAAQPKDSYIVTLPGASAPAPKEPAPKESSTDSEAVPAPPKSGLPEAFKSDSSLYLQRVIGIWKKQDAEALLGDPIRSRQAVDESKKVNGQVYTWTDPTGRYRELELDFDSNSGRLRTVFAYPTEMTWEDCRKLWGANVNTTHTKNGRTFYSYLNRKLDVLVDRDGKVISLGLY